MERIQRRIARGTDDALPGNVYNCARWNVIFRIRRETNGRAKKVGVDKIGLRWHQPGGDWLLIVGLVGAERIAWSEAEFTRPAAGRCWEVALHSNERRFGGKVEARTIADVTRRFTFSGPAALLLREVEATEGRRQLG